MIKNISVNTQSSIKFNMEKIIYFDPYKIENNINDADIIFITHEHYDHFSKEDINKVKKEDTILVIPESLKNEVYDLNFSSVIFVKPNNSYEVLEYKFDTVNAYNKTKEFHLKEKLWVGYIITINNIKYYIMGDTDYLEELSSIDADVVFVPIGGYFTMDANEAANLINKMKPKVVVPIHYGTIVGKIKDGESFKSLIDSSIECKLLLFN